MNKHARYVNNTLCLRNPQSESLEVFEKICDVLSLNKNVDLTAELQKVQTLCPSLSSFEREFPSICFALATGIGKAPDGAFIAYLYYAKGIKTSL